MNNTYGHIYEQSQNESFERQIYSGHLTESQIQDNINNNLLSESQIVVAEGILGRAFDRTKGFLKGRSEPKGYDRDYEYEQAKGSSALKRHRAVLQRALDDYLNDLRVLDIATPEIEASIRNMKSELDKHVMDIPTGGPSSSSYSSSREPLTRNLTGQWAQGRKGRFVKRQGSLGTPQ